MAASDDGVAGFDVLRSEVLRLIDALTTEAQTRGATTTVERLRACAQRLVEAPLTVVVCGEFKRGKSSLLNALLDEREPYLFPVNARVATRIVTKASWSETERIEVTLDADGGPEIRGITRSEIADYATEAGNPEDARRAVAIDAHVPNARLRGGLTLVDTPGVGGVFADHTAATMGFLPQADAIVFVSDFTQPLLVSELDFIRQASAATRIAGDLGALLFVVTKSDAVSDAAREEMLQNTRAKLADVTGEPAGSLTIVPVSSLAKLDHLADGDPQDLADSGFERLDAELTGTLARRRATVVLGAALTDAEESAVSLLRPLDNELTALDTGTREKLDELKDEAVRRQAELTSLQRGQAAWRSELRRQLQRVGKDLQRDARLGLAEIWHRCDNRYLHDPAYLADPDKLVERLVADVALLAGSIGAQAEQSAAGTLREFARAHGLELASPEVGSLPPPRVTPVTVTGDLGKPVSRGRGWEKARQFTQGGTVGGTIGFVVGGLIGALAGPPGILIGQYVGATIGGLAGGGTSLRTASDRNRQADDRARRTSIRTELGPLRTAQQHDMDANLDVLVEELVVAVSADLDGRVAQQQESLGDEVRRLEGTRRSTAEQATARRKALDAERAPLARVRDELAAVAVRAARLGERIPAADAAVAAPGGAG